MRAKNVKRNLFFGFINRMVLLLFPFLIRTIILKKLGTEFLGLNSLFTSILQVLNLTELGFSSAIVHSLYKPIAEKNSGLICAYMSFYKKVYKRIGTVILCAGIMLLPFLEYFITGNVPKNINIYFLFCIYLFNTVISYYCFGYKNALINAHQRNDIVSNVSTLSQSCMYMLQITILYLTNNYYCYLIIMPMFTIVNNLLTGYISNKLYPQYGCIGTLKDDAKKKIKDQVTGLLIHRLCLVSRNSFDSIFITAFLGLRIAGIYSNYYYIMNTIIGILSIVGNSMLAGIGDSIATESIEKNYIDMKKINFIYMIISGWCTICMLCLYQPFMTIWVGNELMFDFHVVILFCVYFYVLKMGDIRGTYSDAAGLWWENRYRAVIEVMVNLILNIVFVQLLGIYGIILATLVSLFFINFIWGSRIIFNHYFKGVSVLEYYLQHGKYAFITVIIAIVTYQIVSRVSIQGIIGLIVKLIVCSIVSACLYFIFYIRNPLGKDIVCWLHKKIKA